MDDTKHSEEAIFESALEMADAFERKAFLDQACRDNSCLRSRIERLLKVHGKAEKFFAKGAVTFGVAATDAPVENAPPSYGAGTRASEPVEETPGSRIGPYKLLQKIGEGGCGGVYMAEQQRPVRRRVAVKVIKLGMDTKAVIARFEAERQALALMDHPNIARVLDAGATEAGRPYFVMELVHGVRITEYCDENQLGTRQRLNLFIQICHAIQHAHQKGVIHRDIKPSNILVTLHDGVPVPKVIDFGIAKATGGESLTDKTMFTSYGQFIGTPAYMSPEQAQMSGLDVDTRSDIYSLGVLLYELLTGKTPFDQHELMASGLDEMRRTLREREPHRPSTKLDTLANTELTMTAQRRHVEPPALRSELRGDLDWVVMKALEKDRTRRYETANALAMDIERFLNNEPVAARPPSRFYRFQKLVQRNRGVFAAIGAVALALLTGLGASTWLFLKARNAEQQQARLRRESEIRERITQAALQVSQGKFEEADQLASVIPLNQPSLEGAAVLRSLGEWHARHGEWRLAADRFIDLQRINQLDGLDISTMDMLGCGAALAQLGDASRYEQFRQSALARHADEANLVVAVRLAKTCLLLPASMSEVESVQRLIRKSLSDSASNIKTRPPPNVAWRRNPSGSISVQAWDSTPGKNGPVAELREASSHPGESRPGERPRGVMPIFSETTLPALAGVTCFDGTSVGIEFNSAMDADGLLNPVNYRVSGTTVTNVTLSGDATSVTLWLSERISGDYIVEVENVRDASGNLIDSGSTVGGRVLDLQVKDYDTGQPYSVTCAGNEARITAGGQNIWDGSDSFVYWYTRLAGDFDYRMRVCSIGPVLDLFTRVGLMARDSLNDASSREFMVAVNAGDTFQVLTRTAAGAQTASLPPNPLPPSNGSNSWIRLQRVGNVLHCYRSANGADWAHLYQYDSASGVEGPFADPVCFGIAVCAHSATNTATAVVRDLGPALVMPAEATLTLALLDFRRGEYSKALEWCNRCLADPDYNAARNATAHIVLAMSNARLLRADEARFNLQRARKMIESRHDPDTEVRRASQGFWFDWVFVQTLLREADVNIH